MRGLQQLKNDIDSHSMTDSGVNITICDCFVVLHKFHMHMKSASMFGQCELVNSGMFSFHVVHLIIY